jgi:hypothetical protein
MLALELLLDHQGNNLQSDQWRKAPGTTTITNAARRLSPTNWFPMSTRPTSFVRSGPQGPLPRHQIKSDALRAAFRNGNALDWSDIH